MKVLFIVFFLFLLFTIPAFAQEESFVDIFEGLNEYGALLFTITASIIGSFVGGTLLGNFISNKRENDRQKKELENSQLLLKSDFTTFRRMLINGLKNRKKSLEYFRDGKELDDKLKAWDRLQVTSPFSTQRYFLFWKSIEKSGNLLKFKPIELKTIQIVMDELNDADAKFQKRFVEFSNFFKQKNAGTDKSVYAYLDYNEHCYNLAIHMLKIIKMMENIDWFDYESEVLPPKNKKDEKDFEIPDEIKQDWSDLQKRYRSGKSMGGFIDEMEFIEKEINKTKKDS